ncbi:MAG: hypothetical protein ABJF10_21510 [Chthoniobacter sp.]|uniref:hypothetical protein n=1 Tax=Chthoniobacter sp. TaxID=2510640 RepID=UPI0032A31B40
MKYTLLTFTFATLTFASPLRALDSRPTNPALLYWQAAAIRPQLTPEQAKEVHEVVAGRKPYDAMAAAKILSDSKSSLLLAFKAADSTVPCDWGMPVEDGPFMALPHVSKMQEMGAVAILQAEDFFAEGKVKEGLDYLLLTHRLARHAGAGDMLISNLVQYAIETNALRAAARHCLAWDADTRKTYAAQLKTLPPLHTTQAAYGGESAFIDWLDTRFSVAGADKTQVEELLNMEGTDKWKAKEALLKEFTPEGVKAFVAEMRSLQLRAQAGLGEAWPQCHAAMKAVDEDAQHSTFYVVRSMVAPTVNVGEKQFVIATLRTMLDAALEHGAQLDEATAATYHDAFTGDPLRFKKDADGTITLLTAQPHPAGKELSLKFGK